MILVRLIRRVLVVFAMVASLPAAALTPEQIGRMVSTESGVRIETLNAIAASGDESAIPFLQALAEGNVQTSATARSIVILVDGKGTDAVTGKPVEKLPEDLDEVVANNVFRRELAAAIATLRLTSTDRAVRLAAAKTLQDETESDRLPLVERAIAKETDAEIRQLLERVRANLQLNSKDKAVRLAAITSLGSSVNPGTKTILLEILARKGGEFVEPDADIRFAAQKSLTEVEGRLATGERIGQVFSGASLGSILLLAALGLAITYGLMGVINMAHGELIMIGAYTTYLVQNFVRANLPDLFNWYLLAALPASFMVAAAVGMVLERTVIRHLYGRPLETLLATWGISLILIQAVRTIFGAQNVQVENPVWMSGGVELLTNVVLPWSRIVIIAFSGVVLLLVWLALTRTRLGLFVRGVTQNRSMASCLGIHTGRIDTWCFGLGSGIAGLAGCALSQIGNVGPDLGQSYIVDSFMVVVLGGVGQLAGTVYAAIGLGVVNKFLEGISGAVLAKITVLVFIIIFIQKRPQGMFALKGRFADA
jgi:urea transport system permease protein